MRLKTVEVFLALGLLTTVAACDAANEGGEAEDTAPTTEQSTPLPEATTSPADEGGEGGEGS
ncbi:hypothetical protein [Lyngbya aestuarii]|uniref:hypothetical protein n=1 Tax=Lyngbya aestuarii TaxID=118322 RepID=UPI00403DE74D